MLRPEIQQVAASHSLVMQITQTALFLYCIFHAVEKQIDIIADHETNQLYMIMYRGAKFCKT